MEPGRRGDRGVARARAGSAARCGRGRGGAAPEVLRPPEEAQRARSGAPGEKAPSAPGPGRGRLEPAAAAPQPRARSATRPTRPTRPATPRERSGLGGGREEAVRRPGGELRAPRSGLRHCTHMASGVGAAFEELPHDGTCDECEPDEAPGAQEVCRECGFCYCRRHAEAHRRKFPGHHLAQYVHGCAQAWTSGAQGESEGKEDVEAKVENDRDVEVEMGEESESEEDSESEEESETEEESEDESDEESEEDSEEEMEDEQESEAEEDNRDDGDSEAEGETEAESEFDPEIEMEAERVAKRKCPDHGLDLSTYCQEDKQLICVLCPVIGAHQRHQLSTLDEAFEELRVSIVRSEHRGQDTWVSAQVASLWPCALLSRPPKASMFNLLGAVLSHSFG